MLMVCRCGARFKISQYSRALAYTRAKGTVLDEARIAGYAEGTGDPILVQVIVACPVCGTETYFAPGKSFPREE